MSKDIEKLRLNRQDAQAELVVMIRRMKIHQIIYDVVKRKYTKTLMTYQKADLAYALKTKITICPDKTKKKAKKTRTRKNVMPSKVKKLLSDLPEEARNRIIAAYR